MRSDCSSAAGYEVEFPRRQVCCGTAGVQRRPPRGRAPRSRAASCEAFARDAPVIVPSGSCVTMRSHYLPELLGVEPFEVWELSAFLDAAGF